MQRPRLTRSDLTGKVYVVTRYKLKKVKDREFVVASKKYDVTEEFNALRKRAEHEEAEARSKALVPTEWYRWSGLKAHLPYDPSKVNLLLRVRSLCGRQKRIGPLQESPSSAWLCKTCLRIWRSRQ